MDYKSIPREEGGNDYFEMKIKMRAYKDRFISLDEEEELLHTATKLMVPAMSLKQAHEFIVRWAQLNHVAVESQILRRAADMLKARTLDDGQIDQDEFEAVVAFYRQACYAKLPDDGIRARLKSMMIDKGFKAKRDGFFGAHWFKSIHG